MLARLLIAAVVGAVVLQVWGLVFWTLNPMGRDMLRAIDGEDEVLALLQENIPETGVYFAPLVDSYADNKDRFLEKHKRGPIVRISYRREGTDAANPMVFIKGFLHFIVSTLLVGSIMMKALPRLGTYWSRVVFVMMLGIFAAFYIDLADPIWLHAPLRYYLYLMDFHIISWLLVGLAIAPIIKPKTEAMAQELLA